MHALGPCLESLEFCREIVIVDSGSDDGTLDLIQNYRDKGYPIRLFKRDWPGYALQKQFALDQCSQDWCLNLDADERVDARLREEIVNISTSGSSHSALRLRRREWLANWGYAPPLVGCKSLVRLVRKGVATYDTDRFVHESLQVKGSTGDIRSGYLLHKNVSTIESDQEKQNRYTSLKVQERLRDGVRPNPWRMLTAPIGYFLKVYLLKRYFLCGWAGFIQAGLSAQYAFQTEIKHWSAGDRRAETQPADTSS